MPALSTQPRGDAVIEKLVTGGVRVFLERGYEGTSVDAVAAETKTSKATIYRYFPDKEALFRAIVQHAIRVGRAPIDFKIPSSGGIRAALMKFAETCIERTIAPAQVDLCRVFAFEIRRFPEIEALFSQSDEADSRWSVAIFEKLAAEGVLKIRDPEQAAGTFWALVVHPFIMRALFRPRLPLEASERRLHVKVKVDQFLTLYPPIGPKK